MTKEKQIEEMENFFIETDQNFSNYCGEKPCNDCELNGLVNCESHYKAQTFYNAGYRKANEVALDTVDDFQSRLRHIFLDMCEGNDYNTVNLLQIDSAIEALFDSFVAELKKKYRQEK